MEFLKAGWWETMSAGKRCIHRLNTELRALGSLRAPGSSSPKPEDFTVHEGKREYAQISITKHHKLPRKPLM